ncbi:MAG: hypothetical protein M0R80_04950 [Proteobacteria bacterium]|nr:hypothetical protein [Pseudomonadota bacterium]
MTPRIAIIGVVALWITACGSAVAVGLNPTDPADPTDRPDAGAPAELPPPPVPVACGCTTSADEPIELHVFARELSREKMDALAAMLAKDGFTVSFVEYADESSVPKVAIETTPTRFVAVFRGRIEMSSEPLSSRDGFMCRPAVEGTVIPKRYRKYVVEVGPPDPQLY